MSRETKGTDGSGSTPPGAATKVIVDRVAPEKRSEFEAWAGQINAAVATYDGYLGAEVFPPRGDDDPEFVTVIHFDTPENLTAWEESDECRRWLDAANGFITETQTRTAQGIELWFMLPPRRRAPQPAPWKSILVSSVAVYGLLLLLGETLDPFTEDLPDRLALAISVVVLSTLLTWPVLPYATRALSGWLYPRERSPTRR